MGSALPFKLQSASSSNPFQVFDLICNNIFSYFKNVCVIRHLLLVSHVLHSTMFLRNEKLGSLEMNILKFKTMKPPDLKIKGISA